MQRNISDLFILFTIQIQQWTRIAPTSLLQTSMTTYLLTPPKVGIFPFDNGCHAYDDALIHFYLSGICLPKEQLDLSGRDSDLEMHSPVVALQDAGHCEPEQEVVQPGV